MFGPMLFLRDKSNQFLPARDQLRQALLDPRERDRGGGREEPTLFRQHRRVQRVGLGQQALGAGEVANLARINERDQHLGLLERGEEMMFITARGLANNLEGAAHLTQRAATRSR